MKAYAALSKRKAADKITVSDLCQEAEFSRNTFYTYYKIVSYTHLDVYKRQIRS